MQIMMHEAHRQDNLYRTVRLNFFQLTGHLNIFFVHPLFSNQFR